MGNDNPLIFEQPTTANSRGITLKGGVIQPAYAHLEAALARYREAQAVMEAATARVKIADAAMATANDAEREARKAVRRLIIEHFGPGVLDFG